MSDIQIYNNNVGVESFFIRIMHPTDRCGVWLKFTFLKAYSGIYFKVWSTYFDQTSVPQTVCEVFPIDHVKVNDGLISWPKGFIDFNNGSTGRIKEHSWSFHWNVVDDKAIKLLPSFLYSNLIPTTKLITPCPRLSVVGELRAPTVLFSYNNLTGMLGHNWGPKHSREYVWIFGSSQRFVVEGFSTKIFPM